MPNYITTCLRVSVLSRVFYDEFGSFVNFLRNGKTPEEIRQPPIKQSGSQALITSLSLLPQMSQIVGKTNQIVTMPAESLGGLFETVIIQYVTGRMAVSHLASQDQVGERTRPFAIL